MCGIIGIKSANLNIEKANVALDRLSKRGPDEEGEFLQDDVYIGHKRLVLIDKENGKQPFVYKDFVITYNGDIYNADQLRATLKTLGHKFVGYSDTEVLVQLYARFREKCLDVLTGIFSFLIFNRSTGEFFGARDRIGVKPFYYYFKNNDFMVASEIKSILEYFEINTISKKGLTEILALGPSHTQGEAIYSNVFELRPGHFITLKDNDLQTTRYWNVAASEHTDSFEDTVANTRWLLKDSVKGQLVADVPTCTFLSGGLDSTIITIIAKNINPNFQAFSIDYRDNEKFFVGNDFQMTRDNDFIRLVKDRFSLSHNYKIIDNEELVNLLDEALVLRDYPGMVDIDSSLHWFAKEVKKSCTIALSGECADEIFGGYPWYYKEPFDNNFPWIRNGDEREMLLNDNYRRELKIKDYTQQQIDNSLSEAPLTGNETDSDKKHKQLMYLNLNWFMQTLLERKDRMVSGAGLAARVPFADFRIVEYLYNVPWEMKFYNQMEKGLLREAVKDFVPQEIVYRKKNPYPKTYNPNYLNAVTNLLEQRLKNKDSILYELFDANQLKSIMTSDEITKPWFGQLMGRAQMIAYLYQFDLWFEKYNLNIV